MLVGVGVVGESDDGVVDEVDRSYFSILVVDVGYDIEVDCFEDDGIEEILIVGGISSVVVVDGIGVVDMDGDIMMISFVYKFFCYLFGLVVVVKDLSRDGIDVK